MKILPLVLLAAAAGVGFALLKRQAGEDQIQSGLLDAGGVDENGFAGAVSGLAGLINKAIDEVAEIVGYLKPAAMRSVDKSLVNHRNVRAFLRVIREKESSQSDMAYRMIVGGGLFNGFADHPRIKGVCWKTATGKQLCSTAAGAYQITATTWDETRAAMGLPDFSPASQDLAALGRIAARGALQDVLTGNIAGAVSKLKKEWEAFERWPDVAPYKQVFLAYGGAPAGSVVA